MLKAGLVGAAVDRKMGQGFRAHQPQRGPGMDFGRERDAQEMVQVILDNRHRPLAMLFEF